MGLRQSLITRAGVLLLFSADSRRFSARWHLDTCFFMPQTRVQRRGQMLYHSAPVRLLRHCRADNSRAAPTSLSCVSAY